MSQQLISRSPDLKRLQDEGYDIEIRASHLLVKHVPYRNAGDEVAYGVLVSGLDLAGDVTVTPCDHRAWFVGGIPHGRDGQKLARIINSEGHTTHLEGLVSDCTFSSKPTDGQGYRDYHHKMTTYVSMISAPARQLDASVTATTYPVIADDDEDSVFKYIDTATSRAGIAVATEKLKVGKIAIVGLGGTGSYILDFVSKTPVEEIHIFDADRFLQHNAFRSPGAASHEELSAGRSKVMHFEEQYSRLRRNIVAHDYFIDVSNVDELTEMDFVFIAADSGDVKTLIAARLEEVGVPFIDVGMGLYETGGLLGGCCARRQAPQRIMLARRGSLIQAPPARIPTGRTSRSSN